MVPIKSIMTTNVIFTKKDVSILEAVETLSKNNISGMPVVNDQLQVVGILSQKDVLEILLDKRLDLSKTVEDYMTRKVVCFNEEDKIVDICKFFIKSYVRRVPILQDGKLVGIVSRRDIVKLILELGRKTSDFRYA